MIMASTRSSETLYLIGVTQFNPLSDMRQLPSVKEVLQRFHYHLKLVNSIRNATHLTIDELLTLWAKAALPTTIKRNAVEKLEHWHSVWSLLKKNKSRLTATQRQREVEFSSEVNKLFDIAHADALAMIKIEEDRDFLKDQRQNRCMYIASEDKKLAKKKE